MPSVPTLSRATGFTLLELMITVAIIGIVSSVAATNMIGQIPRHRLNSATTQLVWTLRALRMQAISRNSPITVTFTSAHVYTIWTDSNGNGATDSGEVQTKDLRANYQGVTFASTNNPVFNPTGTVSNLAAITLSGAGSSKLISMSASGDIKSN